MPTKSKFCITFYPTRGVRTVKRVTLAVSPWGPLAYVTFTPRLRTHAQSWNADRGQFGKPRTTPAHAR